MKKENTTNTKIFIRPAGAFPQTPEGWKQYQSQFKMIEDQYKKWGKQEERKKTKDGTKRNRP